MIFSTVEFFTGTPKIGFFGEPKYLIGEPKYLVGEPKYLIGEPDNLAG